MLAPRLFAFCAIAASETAFGALTVVETDGAFRVLRDGVPIVDRITVNLGGDGKLPTTRRSFETMADGSKAWNVWAEEPNRRYRLEVAARSDGAVEVTLSGDIAIRTDYRARKLILSVPSEAFEGKKFEALEGSGRAWKPTAGSFDGAFKRGSFRWMVADGIVWDFNPIGAGDYCSTYSVGALNGVWSVRREGKNFNLSAGGAANNTVGGMSGAKIVIREGVFADYDRYHFIRSFHYSQHLVARKSVVFGAPKYGKDYVDGNVAYNAKVGFGWMDGVKKVVVGNPSGAYYSHVVGRDRSIYRVAGLPDGFYIFTLQVGNWTGETNRFSVRVNGIDLGTNVSVAKQKARTLSRAVHVTGGVADVVFDGNWIVSAICVQPVMGDGEDFSVRRGPWVSNGYEPSACYRNEDYLRKPVFPLADETIDMPPPGKECAGAFRSYELETRVPDVNSPSAEWVKHIRIDNLLGNSATLAEFDEPGSFATYLDQEKAGKGYNTYMLSGMHSRHTFPNHIERGRRAIGKIAEELHRRGAKLIDHHDVTMFWNVDSGFRVMMERLPEALRSVSDNLPSYQLCLNNPMFKQKEFAYLRGLVKAGVDGFQLDEVSFWEHGCGCKACRDRFHAETGWWIPLDETHPAFADVPTTALAKRWLAWRRDRRTDWFIDLRKAVEDLRPGLCLNTYTTHWGFVSSHPLYRRSADIIDCMRTFSVFGTEVMTRCAIQSSRSLLPYRKMNNVFTMATDAPVWGLYYNSDWQDNYFTWAVGNMVGQLVLASDLPKSKDEPEYERWGTSAANMRREGAVPVAEVALFFSSQSRDWNRHCGFEGELFGMAQELEAMHVPYEFVTESIFDSAHLKKYKTLVLAASNCISDRHLAVIRAFAERGGTVVLSSIAGLFNEIGDLRKNWPFADILGFKVEPPCLKVAADESATYVEKPFGKGRFVYFPKLYAERFYACEITHNQKWTFDPDLKAEASYRRTLAEVMEGSTFWQVCEVPDKVYTTIWREADGTLAIHFLNATGANLKPGERATSRAPDPAFPALPADIVFTLPPGSAGKVVAQSPDFPVACELNSVRNADGTLTVTLPKDALIVYTVVHVGAAEDSFNKIESRKERK